MIRVIPCVSYLFCVCMFAGPGISRNAGGAGSGNTTAAADPQTIVQSLVGSWKGTSRTWFRPGELADESPVRGEFRLILNGRVLRHTYAGEMQGKPRCGEETIIYNSVIRVFQTAWIDDFHMNYGIMFSEGRPGRDGFSVTGHYAVAPDQPFWSWKTVYALIDENHLTITAFNILPGGEEVKAVETVYIREQER